jgi:hypothetical protein
MYALAHSPQRRLAPILGDPQPMPSFYAPGRPLRCIVREDKDQPFAIHIIGKVAQAAGMEVQVLDPGGALVRQATVPQGLHDPFEIAVPGDGKTGQYVVWVKNLDRDDLFTPLTSLPEVYVSDNLGTDADQPGRYFTRCPGAEPCDITVEGERGKIFAADQRTLLGSSKERPATARIGPEGAWIWSYMGYVRGYYTADKSPLILAVNPARWFLPESKALALKPAPWHE